MSFHEKSAWAMLVVLILVYSGYFQTAFEMHDNGVTSMAAAGPMMISAIIGIIVLSIVSHIAIAIFSARGEDEDTKDERDRLISMRGDSRSSFILGIGIVTAILQLFFEKDSFIVGHVLLASLVVAELVKNALTIVGYRRGV